MPTALSARFARLAATDTDLLARFAAARDGMAFAELVRRHGPMVLAVCRRVTRHAHDAEDAFQAAFLVLARKADRLGPGDRVAAWLYGVALRAARRACERRGREALVATVPDVPDRTAEPVDPDAARVVVEEVGRLPDIFRAAVVLCELEGRTRAAAARELGIAEGTLSSRLALARKRLAVRLAARGFGPAALAALVGAAVPPRLASAASAFGSSAAASPAVATLAHGVCRAMMPHSFRAVALAAGLLAVAALAVGQPDAPRPAPAPLRVAAPPPAPPAKNVAGPNRIVVWHRGDIVSMDPDSGNRKVILAKDRAPDMSDVLALSPDGKRAVIVHWRNNQAATYVYDLGRARPESDRDELAEIDGHATYAWSADGSNLAVCTDLPGEWRKTKAECFLYNPTTKARTPLKWPAGHTLCDWSPDGRTFLTTVLTKERPTDSLWELWTVDRDGTPKGRLPGCPKNASTGRYSPDGKRVLVTVVRLASIREPKGQTEPEYELTVIDLATGRATPVRGIQPDGLPMWSGWSPDGSRIAYMWKKNHPLGVNPEVGTWTHLIVCDPDGGNARGIYSDKIRFRNEFVLRDVQWR